MLIAAFFTISKIWRQTKSPSTVEWIKKKINVHTESWPLNNTWMEHWPPSHPATVESPCITLQLTFHICSYIFQAPTKHESCGTVASTYWKIFTYQWTNEFKPMLFKCLLCITLSAALEWYIHTHTQWNTIQPWEEVNLCICYHWMDSEDIILSEIRQARQILYEITYMWNLKKKKKTNT